MFTKLRIKNFKAWGDSLSADGFPLGRLTLFLGANSSGKTSLLQPFRLMQQTVTGSDPNLQLNLGGESTDLVNLGAWSDVIHQHRADATLGVGFDLAVGGGTTALDLSYRLDSGGRIVVDTLAYARANARYAAARQGAGGYLLSAPGYEPAQRSGGTPDAKRAYAPIRSIAFPPEAMLALGASHSRALGEMSLTMLRRFESISYLGPLRAPPRRTHQWNQQRPGNLGVDGGGAIKALLSSANDRKRRDELIKRVGSWLQRMKVAEDLSVVQLGTSSHYEVRVLRDELDSNLMDVGFGISQVLPVLTLAYFAPQRSTVIIEEPEIHLHPLAQSLLAELFVEISAERNIQFLIETHSEHMFRRLQYLIADGRIGPSECRMYFVDRDDQRRARLNQLEVGKFGRIENWPTHFFGDSVGEVERQTRRTMERMRGSDA